MAGVDSQRYWQIAYGVCILKWKRFFFSIEYDRISYRIDGSNVEILNSSDENKSIDKSISLF